jgi:hypothetical protein
MSSRCMAPSSSDFTLGDVQESAAAAKEQAGRDGKPIAIDAQPEADFGPLVQPADDAVDPEALLVVIVRPDQKAPMLPWECRSRITLDVFPSAPTTQVAVALWGGFRTRTRAPSWWK